VKLGGIFMFTGGMNVLSGGSTWYLAHAVSKRVDLK
jgi:hypothetical protein